MDGQEVCYHHGGNAPQNRKAAQRRLAAAKMQTELGKLVEELRQENDDRHPVEILLDSMHKAYIMANVLELRVTQLEVAGIVYLDGDNNYRPHPALTEMRAWNDQAAKLSKMALDAGVEERRVRMEQELVTELGKFTRGIVADLGHDLNDPKVQEVIKRRMLETTSIEHE